MGLKGTRLFGLADSIWPFRSEPFRSDRFGLAVSVTGIFGHETFRSNYEILQKSYMFTV